MVFKKWNDHFNFSVIFYGLFDGWEAIVDISSEQMENTGNVPRELILTFYAIVNDCPTGYFSGKNKDYTKGTWSNSEFCEHPDKNIICFYSEDGGDNVISYLPTQDEWDEIKQEGFYIYMSGAYVEKIVIKEI